MTTASEAGQSADAAPAHISPSVEPDTPLQTGLDERKPDQWQRISLPAWRALKKSIVAAGAAGAISGPTAERLIDRFHLKDV